MSAERDLYDLGDALETQAGQLEELGQAIAAQLPPQRADLPRDHASWSIPAKIAQAIALLNEAAAEIQDYVDGAEIG